MDECEFCSLPVGALVNLTIGANASFVCIDCKKDISPFGPCYTRYVGMKPEPEADGRTVHVFKCLDREVCPKCGHVFTRMSAFCRNLIVELPTGQSGVEAPEEIQGDESNTGHGAK